MLGSFNCEGKILYLAANNAKAIIVRKEYPETASSSLKNLCKSLTLRI
jgi:hypothetical protein